MPELVSVEAAGGAVAGGFAGFVTGLVTFRTQLAISARDMAEMKAARRQDRNLLLALLQVVSDMAGKIGVDNRSVSDLLIRSMQDDNEK